METRMIHWTGDHSRPLIDVARKLTTLITGVAIILLGPGNQSDPRSYENVGAPDAWTHAYVCDTPGQWYPEPGSMQDSIHLCMDGPSAVTLEDNASGLITGQRTRGTSIVSSRQQSVVRRHDNAPDSLPRARPPPSETGHEIRPDFYP